SPPACPRTSRTTRRTRARNTPRRSGMDRTAALAAVLSASAPTAATAPPRSRRTAGTPSTYGLRQRAVLLSALQDQDFLHPVERDRGSDQHVLEQAAGGQHGAHVPHQQALGIDPVQAGGHDSIAGGNLRERGHVLQD